MKALLLLAFGGPRSLDEVESFLTRLMKGRKPSPEQLERVKDRYRLIGGSSPLLEVTWGQAKALEKKLIGKGYPFKSYVGMRYGYPLIEETFEEILRDGIQKIIAIPMSPYRSRFSTNAYIEEVNRVKKKLEEGLEISFIVGWHSHPLFLEAVREKVHGGLMQFTPQERKRTHLIFTAHSLPKSVVENEPYIKDMEESVKGVLKQMGSLPWHIAFQSRGSGEEEWLKPDVESVLETLSNEKVREVLIVPIGFVSDHIEILYDIDIVYRKKAESLGMVLKRSPSLNLSEPFIEALSNIVEQHIHNQLPSPSTGEGQGEGE
jgi:ferrochelatase